MASISRAFRICASANCAAGLLQRLALGDVADDGQDGPLVVEQDRRGVDLDRDDPAVLGPVPPLAGEVAVGELLLEPLLVAGGELGVVDVVGRQRQELLAGVAQEPAGRRVGVEDPAVQGVDEDGVLDPLEEGPAPAAPRRPARPRSASGR